VNHTAILYTVMGIALVGGTVVVLLWWSLADKFFPGADKSTGQRIQLFRRPPPGEPAQVVKMDEPPVSGTP
jgi:hypothetical protein